MTRVVIYSGVEVQLRDPQSDPKSTANWEYRLPNSIPLMYELYNLPFLQVTIDFYFECAPVAGIASKGDRFLNPSQSQIGYYQVLSDDFVLEYGRVLYAKQNIRLRPIHYDMANSFPNRPVVVARTLRNSYDTIENDQLLRWCIISAPNSDPNVANQQAVELPSRAFSARSYPGEMELATREPNPQFQPELNMTIGQEYPEKISGVLWSGWTGTIRVEASIQGDMTPPLYKENFQGTQLRLPAPICNFSPSYGNP